MVSLQNTQTAAARELLVKLNSAVGAIQQAAERTDSDDRRASLEMIESHGVVFASLLLDVHAGRISAADPKVAHHMRRIEEFCDSVRDDLN